MNAIRCCAAETDYAAVLYAQFLNGLLRAYVGVPLPEKEQSVVIFVMCAATVPELLSSLHFFDTRIGRTKIHSAPKRFVCWLAPFGTDISRQFMVDHIATQKEFVRFRTTVLDSSPSLALCPSPFIQHSLQYGEQDSRLACVLKTLHVLIAIALQTTGPDNSEFLRANGTLCVMKSLCEGLIVSKKYRAIVINAAFSTQRMESFARWSSSDSAKDVLSLERLEAIVPDCSAFRCSPGEVGCLLSHRRAWTMIVEQEKEEDEYTLVFEDDARPSFLCDPPLQLSKLIVLALETARLQNVDVVSFSCNGGSSCQLANEQKVLTSFNCFKWGTTAYALNKRAATFLLATCNDMNLSVDAQMILCSCSPSIRFREAFPFAVDLKRDTIGMFTQGDHASIIKQSKARCWKTDILPCMQEFANRRFGVNVSENALR